MYKRVDQIDEESVEGFSYLNQDLIEEVVKIQNGIHVTIRDGDSNHSHIYFSDIPNLIKALQAAFDFKEGK